MSTSKAGGELIETEKDVLDEIFVDKNEPANKKLLVEILKPLATIDPGGVISFSSEYSKLEQMKRAMVYLVCKKAMVLRGIPNIIEPAGPAEVSKGAIISESNAKNALCTHYNKFLKKEKEGYVIPNYNLNKIKELIFEKNE